MEKDYIQTVVENDYLRARKYIGICNEKRLDKILIYGTNALDFINSFASKKIESTSFKAGFTLLMYRKKLLDEVLIIKLSALRYLILGENLEKTLKILNKNKRKFPLITINLSTDKYTIFSFHGDKCIEYFNTIDSNNLYRIVHQGYTYYILITYKKNESTIFTYFVTHNFIPISLETKALFLYNNGVMTQLHNIKNKWKNYIFDKIYKSNNYKYIKKNNPIEIKQFEMQDNGIALKNSYIYDGNNHRVGIIHCSYRIPNKKYPYIMCYVWNKKITKTAILKSNNKEILLKQFVIY